MKRVDSYAERFVPEGMANYRTRAWARYLVVLCGACGPLWIIFFVLGAALHLPSWFLLLLPAFAAAHLAVPLVLRRTGSLFTAMMLFGMTSLGGIILAAVVMGGFPFHVLMWAIILPITVAGQRQHRSLIWIWGMACIALFALWFTLSVTGHAPAGSVELSASSKLWLQAVTLATWVGALLIVSTTAAAVTYEFADLRDAYQRAVLQAQKLDAMGKLAGSIENSFNNALMSIDYAAHLLSEEISDAELQTELGELTETVRRSKSLSRKLNRLGGGAEVVERVNVDAAVAALETSLRRLTEPRVRMRMVRSARDGYVRCDPNQLDQVLVNLVVNAADAMPAGGEIVIATSVTESGVIIEVRDTGSGIEPELLRHIFEPFFTTKSSDRGTGLGLWICRSIVLSCGGNLTADTEVGRGTTMRIELPLADASATDGVPTRSDPDKASGGGAWSADHRPRTTRSWRVLDWFVRGVAEHRLRVWGTYIAAVSFASVPFWAGFGIFHWAHFGINAMALSLFAGSVLAALVPLLVKVTRSPLVGAFAISTIAFCSLTALAILRGGFQLEILIWTGVIPIAGAHQREFRHFTPVSIAAIAGQYILVFAAAAAGIVEPTTLHGTDMLAEDLTVLLALLGLLLLTFQAAGRAAAQFASERDDYAATLLKSQDVEEAGTFASSIAHDLNNVLTTLELSTEFIASSLPEGHPGQPDLDNIRRGSGCIKELARQLTRFGRTGDDVAPAIPALSLAKLQPMLAPIVGGHIKVHLDLQSGEAAVRVRANELDQVIINLTLNARDAMPDGGDLTITTSATADAVTITVRDSGVGIPSSELDLVCEPFFTTDPDHVGLGLWVCREVVAEAQGELTIESEPGRGTTVRLVLPKVQPSTRPMRESRRQPASAISTSSVGQGPQPVRGIGTNSIRRPRPPTADAVVKGRL